jgi:hypothetical protein
MGTVLRCKVLKKVGLLVLLAEIVIQRKTNGMTVVRVNP